VHNIMTSSSIVSVTWVYRENINLKDLSQKIIIAFCSKQTDHEKNKSLWPLNYLLNVDIGFTLKSNDIQNTLSHKSLEILRNKATATGHGIVKGTR